MMEARFGWFIIGLLAGAVVGYFARVLQGLREKMDEVDEHITKEHDGGYTTPQWLNNVALLIVVCLTAYAAFVSQQSSDKVKVNQASQDRVTTCTQTFLVTTLAALNARTEFTKEQSDANIQLQKAQGEFLGVFIVKKPPVTAANFNAALTKYYASLSTYLSAATKNSGAIDMNPYPTPKQLANCLRGK